MITFQWRKWNKILHRDIGYLSVAMVVIYGVSGIAVNHIGDWKPNYDLSKKIVEIFQTLVYYFQLLKISWSP